jgi:hypothetical protein
MVRSIISRHDEKLVSSADSAAVEPGLVVRRAADSETRACRLMMPEVFGPLFVPDLWVAIDRETSLIVGAAAVAWRPLSKPAGFPVQVHVPVPLRRRGIGRALIDAIARDCAGSAACLHGWAGVREGGAAALFLAATGFVAHHRLPQFEADVERFYAMVKAIRARLERAGKISGEFDIVRLGEAPQEEVAALVGEYFRDTPSSVLAGIARGLVGYDPQRSVVLLHRGEVRGALLYRWSDGIPQIDVNVISEELRRGAANVLLLEAATRNGLEGGARRFRFSCEESVRDTINLARRCGATQFGAMLVFSRAL